MGCHIDMPPPYVYVNLQPPQHSPRLIVVGAHLIVFNMFLQPLYHLDFSMDLLSVRVLDFRFTQYNSLMVGEYV
jgi:hypothetical protein